MSVTFDLRKKRSDPVVANYLVNVKNAIHAASRVRVKGTVRNFCYRMIGVVIPRKHDADFKQIGRTIQGMRLTGEIGWDAFDERHRSLLHRGGWDNLPTFIEELPETFRRDYSEGQSESVYVLYEADGLSGLVQDVCAPLGASWAALKGNSSDPLQMRVARDIVAAGRPAHVIVLTDHDPYGKDIAKDVMNSIPWYVESRTTGMPVADVIRREGFKFNAFAPIPEPPSATVAPDVTIEHLGLHADLLDRLAAAGTTVPDEGTKAHDRTWNSGGYGNTQVEAVPFDILHDLLREAVEAHTDLDILDKVKKAEEADRERLRVVARYLRMHEARVARRST
jgi:hypothetical protein